MSENEDSWNMSGNEDSFEHVRESGQLRTCLGIRTVLNVSGNEDSFEQVRK